MNDMLAIAATANPGFLPTGLIFASIGLSIVPFLMLLAVATVVTVRRGGKTVKPIVVASAVGLVISMALIHFTSTPVYDDHDAKTVAWLDAEYDIQVAADDARDLVSLNPVTAEHDGRTVTVLLIDVDGKPAPRILTAP